MNLKSRKTSAKAAARGEKKPTLAERIATEINLWQQDPVEESTMYRALHRIAAIPEVARVLARKEKESDVPA
jgi:hypothetical protein